jgi:hypothetical protein
VPISNFGANQRLFSIYDGPAYEENNAFLDVTHTPITDCPATGGNCSTSKWMYGQVFGVPKDAKGGCYLPNAAIAWKQPNGFYYPPAFHSNNLFFKNVDIRHFVIEPLFLPGTYNTDLPAVENRYCTYTPDQFQGFTDIDRQTELDDDDGSLTGLVNTISVNKDPFFAAPVETIECASDTPSNMPPACDPNAETCGTAKTSPYNYVTTVVYPDCGENCPQLVKDAPDYLHFWAVDCTNPTCYGVPLYRQDINQNEQGTKPSIRMAGQAIAQRSTLTVNNGSYYMDTTVSEDTQRRGVPSNLVNVFKGGETYYTFLLFAKPKPDDPKKGPAATKQSYQMYVGTTGFNPATDVFEVTADVTSLPIDFQKQDSWDWSEPTYNSNTGMLTVNMDMSFDTFKTNYKKVAKNNCQPATFCSWNDTGDGSCGCSLSPTNTLYNQCQAVCSKWTNKDVICPNGGCFGFGVKFPDTFVASGQVSPPAPACYPENGDWNTPFNPATKSLAGSCFYSSVPTGSFCTTAVK